MPESRKRKIEKPVETKKVTFAETKAGKLLILILCISMVIGLLFAAVFLMINYLA